VCAAPHARKWWANQHPDQDKRIVEGLMRELEHVAAERFVLMSTVEVDASKPALRVARRPIRVARAPCRGSLGRKITQPLRRSTRNDMLK
jgi:hypothetical protein